jgi:hypothetical protein
MNLHSVPRFLDRSLSLPSRNMEREKIRHPVIAVDHHVDRRLAALEAFSPQNSRPDVIYIRRSPKDISATGESESSTPPGAEPAGATPRNFDGSDTTNNLEVVPFSGPFSSFPQPESWMDFSSMWEQNLSLMKEGNVPNTDEQCQIILEAIINVSGLSGIDARAILAVIIQESSGHVHVRTTISPGAAIRNPGLMQSQNGVEFDENDARGSILQMVMDGTMGTNCGDGLMQLIQRYGYIYSAFRAYNSGSVNKADLSDGLGATARYVSDCANRLRGTPPR